MADSEKVMTKHCNNCKRDVAESNFVMHELHCQKNITLCKKCNEPIMKSKMEEHRDEMHALVKCDLCLQSIERSRLEEHKTNLCSNRLLICAFCELSVAASKLNEHESYCSTRTELCVKCQRYVMHRDRHEHEKSDCRLPPRSELPPPIAPDLDPLLWQRFVDLSPSKTTYSREGRERNDFQRGNVVVDPFSRLRHQDLDETSVRHLGNSGQGARRPSTSEEEDQLFDDFLQFALARDLDLIRENQQELSQSKDGGSLLLPCEFCFEIFPSNFILQHQVICGSRFDTEDADDGQSKRRKNVLLGNSKTTTTTMQSRLRADNDDDDISVLPCEFCDNLFPFNELLAHQVDCESNRSTRNSLMTRHPSLPSEMNRSGLHDVPLRSGVLSRNASVPHIPSEISNTRLTGVSKRSPANSTFRPNASRSQGSVSSRPLPASSRKAPDRRRLAPINPAPPVVRKSTAAAAGVTKMPLRSSGADSNVDHHHHHNNIGVGVTPIRGTVGLTRNNNNPRKSTTLQQNKNLGMQTTSPVSSTSREQHQQQASDRNHGMRGGMINARPVIVNSRAARPNDSSVEGQMSEEQRDRPMRRGGSGGGGTTKINYHTTNSTSASKNLQTPREDL